ncbi:MAG: hypothetical protein Q4D58_05920 [Synergistaceae bacterium]|nr:hypothetical protein [Synergistaceae bacterium]
MKKTAALVILLLTALICCGAASADDRWDKMVAQMESREKIRNEGPAFLSQIALLAPAGSDAELWRLSYSAPSLQTAAAAGVALVKKWFPDGDPANWEEVVGFFPSNSYVPRQLVAVNALFNAVSALSRMEEGKYAAAWLMLRFGESSRGRLIFIYNMPEQFRKTLDRLIAETSMPGYWESDKIEGPWPFVPRYNGTVLYDRAVTENYQFLNGMGGIAGSGPYAWDRARGFVYRVIDPNNSIWIKGRD